MSFLRRTPFSQQPAYPAKVDWRGRYADSLTAAVVCGPWGAFEAVSGRFFSKTGTTGYDLKQQGAAVTTSTGSTDVWSLTGLNPLCAATDKISWVVGAYSTTAGILRKRAIRFAHNTSGTIANVDFSDGVSNVIQAGAQVAGVTFATTNGQAQSANTHWFLGFSYDTNNNSAPYLASVDGLTQSTAVSGASVNNLANFVDQIYLGNSGSGFPLNGGVTVALFWNKRLSQDDLNALTANPWQVFNPGQKGTWLQALASGFATAISWIHA